MSEFIERQKQNGARHFVICAIQNMLKQIKDDLAEADKSTSDYTMPKFPIWIEKVEQKIKLAKEYHEELEKIK